MADQSFTNALIHETSPYLLQHAHNPVDWHPWNEGAWKKAKTENKLVLVSIGYSSCHWCHVMERESFEDIATAELMNKHFVSIKVDREERPDVDHIYMSAVQLMTGHGGWPLNCFCLPDGRPIYGGTYFTRQQWQSVLVQLANFYASDQKKAEEYAEELTRGVNLMESALENKADTDFSKEQLTRVVSSWKNQFDLTEGGPDRAPKFPMPNNYEFLLQFAVAEKDSALKDYVLLTLDKMAFGGIYDHAGGGFARYSTDALWKVPHFEKMLYDNAQLVSLYCKAYKLTKNELYKEIVFETLEFIRREMTSPQGGFYAALDADSEGVEGKFYVWRKDELEKILGSDYRVFADYFNVGPAGFWEHENYILLRNEKSKLIADRHNISEEKLKEVIGKAKEKILAERGKRVRPGLDNKIITSWNALMITGYCDAFETFGKNEFLDRAAKAARLILERFKSSGSLSHIIPDHAGGNKSSVHNPAFLDDYSFTIEALIRLYECTFSEQYLHDARALAEKAIEEYSDDATGLFYYTPASGEKLIVRKKEVHDNVIPASNSSLAKGLFMLGKFYDNAEYSAKSKRMLNNIKDDLLRYGSSYSNWCELMMWNVYPFYEIVIAGREAEKKRAELVRSYLPGMILAGSPDAKSGLPLLENRYQENETFIYVCENYACKMPVTSVEKAMEGIR